MLANLEAVLQDSEINALLEQGFQQTAYYDADGDCVEFLAENVAYHGKRLDQWVTVFLSDDDDRLVGCFIKNFAVLLRKYREQFSLVIQQEGVRLDYFFVALSAIPETRHPQEETTYHSLVTRSNNVLVPVDSEQLCAA